MSEPAEISAARQAWIDDVKKLSPAARDGLVQSIMDSAFALGLVVVPRERVVPVYAQVVDQGHGAMTLAEVQARSAAQAAAYLGQEIIGAELATKVAATNMAGRRAARFRVLVIRPEPVAIGEKPAEPLLSPTAPAT